MTDLIAEAREYVASPGPDSADALITRLADALDRVLALHHPLNDLGEAPCAQCLGDEDGESVFVVWPCPTVRAITA